MRVSPAIRLAPLALPLGALAACFSDRGVALEIDVGATGATSVELYLGTEPCDPQSSTSGITCDSIAPPPGQLALKGEIWFRDALAPEVAQVHGRKATFQLRADAPTTVPIAILVGLTTTDPPAVAGAATMRDLAIPVNAPRVITAALAPATAAQPGTTARTDDDRVLVWRKTTPPSSCVMVEHGGTAPVARDFIVPVEDPDCDDVAAPECNPAAFHGTNMVPGARSRPECFSPGDGKACVLGAFGCQDGVPGNDHTCFPLPARTCVPDALCGCPAFDETCVRGKLGSAARIECQVPTMLSVGGISLCPNHVQAAIDLDRFYPSGSCKQPELGAPPGVSFATSHTFDGATMKLSSPGKPCHFTVRWSEGARSPAAAMDDAGILRFPSDAGPDLLLPIVFHFLQPADNCLTTEFTCSYNGDPAERLWSCVP